MKGMAWIAAAAAGTATFVAYKYSRAGYETASYELLDQDGAFEVRSYSDVSLVSAPKSTANPRDRGSFMKLFQYISGENAAGEKISMTTPVFMSGEGGSGKMSFVVPQEVAQAGVPPALDPDLELEAMEPGVYAAVRFAGPMSQEALREQRARLGTW
ncbi:MAG: heme-binding protein, partial [Gemmatimonadetes bacterium]|nr:heme-binding protein [Gemmatimonadota bacterium]